MRLIAYYRVSTGEQGRSGLGIDDQRASVEAYAASGEHEIVREYVEIASGRNDNRPLLSEAIERIAGGEADGVIVAKLDRLARSSVKVGRTMEQSRKQGWKIIALDLGIDTSTAAGELVANVMAAVAQWEARAIGERTKGALAQARERGVVLGRPRDVDEELVARVCGMRDSGMSFRAVAASLNDAGVPTVRGGAQWYASTVRGIVSQRA